jgi:protein-disulfide isomerase
MFQKEGIFVKKLIILCLVVLLSLATAAGASTKTKPGQKFLSAEETMKILQNMGLAQGGKITFVRSAPTGDRQWQSHLFSVDQNGTAMPLVTYVNSREIVVGILFKDGKLVVPKMPVEDMEPRIDMSRLKLSSDRRITFNPKGQQVAYMFTDPDSPYCQSVEQALSAYTGKYKVIVKQFPLEQIHPGATVKSVQKVCASLSRTCDEQTKQEAVRLVQEDVQEGTAIGVDSVPVFFTGDGAVLRKLPDIGKAKKTK